MRTALQQRPAAQAMLSVCCANVLVAQFQVLAVCLFGLCAQDVMSTLQAQAKIEPGFTKLVWHKLEEQVRQQQGHAASNSIYLSATTIAHVAHAELLLLLLLTGAAMVDSAAAAEAVVGSNTTAGIRLLQQQQQEQ